MILGNLDLVDRDGVAQEFQPLIDDVREASTRMADLTEMLGLIGRNAERNLQVVALNHVLPELKQELNRNLPATIAIECRGAEELYNIEADPDLIVAALSRLAFNARDAMPAGGRLRIETCNREIGSMQRDVRGQEIRPGWYVAVSVIDTGRGMMPKVIERAFDPYFTTRYRGKGSGLGLAVVEGMSRGRGAPWRPRAHQARAPRSRYSPGSSPGWAVGTTRGSRLGTSCSQAHPSCR